jgi:hypothetical protein
LILYENLFFTHVPYKVNYFTMAAMYSMPSSSRAMPERVGDHASPSCSILNIPEYAFIVFYTHYPSTNAINDLLTLSTSASFFLELYQ